MNVTHSFCFFPLFFS
ncbi:MAG: CRISPR-associated DxTHG motif protein [Deltaproteobacteria bacterium]|nr:CRISPR-associated DxTHG motif protein [Deltaproteobacteria bacterium]